GLDYLAQNFPHLAITICGFSFGARVGMEVGISDERVRSLISIGTPVSKYNFDFLAACRKPILFVHGDRDEFGAEDDIRTLVEKIARQNPTAELTVIQDASHFFEGHLDVLKQAITDWTRRQLTP
ncbi:MAG: alpha/beta hydrolase, partial [Pyrinomonadaceae bacterium]